MTEKDREILLTEKDREILGWYFEAQEFARNEALNNYGRPHLKEAFATWRAASKPFVWADDERIVRLGEALREFRTCEHKDALAETRVMLEIEGLEEELKHELWEDL